ncbi:MAG: cytochrome c3 family protein [Chloroflexi bacterium]|nr:cytochrome c3 family protein [Chloroflexota bacterium]
MHYQKRTLWVIILLVSLSLLAVSCGVEEVTVTVPVEVVVTETVEVEVPGEYDGPLVPFLEDWESSGHADAEAEAFIHWDEDDELVVPDSCAKCHSSYGYQDFLGLDGSEFGVVDSAAELGSTVDCVACHNDVTITLDSAVMPSGAVLTGLGDESRCMQCHQGRESTVSVDQRITDAGVGDDEVSEDLGFRNIHYFAATATKYGTLAQGGYEYEGNSYDARFDHVEGFRTCIDCHDSHTLEVRVDSCAECHEDVVEVEDLHDVRMQGSQVDFDGDGDMEEGIYYEIEGMRAILYDAIKLYAADVIGSPLVYSGDSYPYFFIDTDEDGEASEEEANRDNSYATWTPRLVRATYNMQVSMKDPGAYAHGGKYIIQLLYDSIADLNTGIDIAALNRIDHGHFAGSEEAFRHWDDPEDEGLVSGSCSRCHSADGLALYLEEEVSLPQPVANGFRCDTCHDDLTEFTLYEASSVTFPSGAEITNEEPNVNLCMTCHQGRSSSASVESYVAGVDLDTVDEGFRFRNIHYFPAGATLYGGDAMGGYQYANRDYVGFNTHAPAARECTQCHDAHALEVQVDECADCHENVETLEDLRTIRGETTPDYDGDGDTEEGMAGEIETLQETLYAAIQAYAADVIGTGIVYDSHSYPYFFDEEGEGFGSFTPRLIMATYNYQYSMKDPGAFTHNGQYMAQLLYDSIMDLASQTTVDTAGMVRP